MKILLMCRNLRLAGGRVVGTNFVKALRAIDTAHRYLIVVPPNVGYEEISLPVGSKMVVYRGGYNPISQWRFDTFVMSKMVRDFDADVVFAMGNIGVVNPPCPQAILFHKPHLVYPPLHYARETKKACFINWLYKRRLKCCLKKTQLVFCQTPVAADRFHHTLGYPIENIHIMPNAVSGFIQVDKKKVGKPAFFNDRPFFNLFFLTKFYAHKNLEILIDLFTDHKHELRDVRCLVTISPEQHTSAPKFLNLIKERGLTKHIVNVGPLSQGELAGYFYHADALLFPTLMESFSGTYLEAMHFGLPILTSELDFAQYVCGDAALYFNPWRPSDIAEKIIRLKNDFDLRKQLVDKGKERINQFFVSWEDIARTTIRDLEALAMGQPLNQESLAN